MKNFFIYSIIVFLLCSCAKGKMYKNNSRQIENLIFSIKEMKIDSTKIYHLSDLFKSTDLEVSDLYKKNIFEPNSEIFYSNKSCISIKTHHKKWLNKFDDIVVMYNGNEGYFACNINDLYTLNQSENTWNLDINVFQIGSQINIFFINN